MMTPALLLVLSGVEVLTGDFRAVTVETGQRVQFRVPRLETITGSSGRCVEEGMSSDEPDTLWLEGSCSGVRTALAWKKDGSRVHIMACAEDVEERTAEQLKLRQRVQQELKRWKSVTACVRKGQVQLWGWVKAQSDLEAMTALERKHGGAVRSFVERIEKDD